MYFTLYLLIHYECVSLATEKKYSGYFDSFFLEKQQKKNVFFILSLTNLNFFNLGFEKIGYLMIDNCLGLFHNCPN